MVDMHYLNINRKTRTHTILRGYRFQLHSDMIQKKKFQTMKYPPPNDYNGTNFCGIVRRSSS